MNRQAFNFKLFARALTLLCLALSCLAFAATAQVAPATTAQPAPGAPPRVADEVLIKIDKGSLNEASRAASVESVRAAHARVGARVVEEFAPLGWQRVKLPQGLSVEEAIKLYRATPGVAAAQPNYIYRINDTVPNDTRFAELYGMTKIAAPAAWDLTKGSASVVVAVIDTGMKYTHEDLQANVWTNPGETGTDAQGHDKASNGVDDDGDGFVDDIHGYDFANNDPDPSDDNGHGTHCAGTIGALGNNSLGVVGVNWQVSLIAVKTHDSAGNSTSAKVIAAFNYITMLKSRGVNIRVTSNSWGGAPEAPAFDQALSDAIAAAGAADILNVFAAGNNNTNTDAQPFYPASYNVPNVVSVAASDQNDNRASFSNFGATSVDLAAPGVGILSTIPYTDATPQPSPSPARYAVLSGTSMAAPHVAGAAALLAAYNPALTASALKATLLNTVDPLAQWSGKTLTGGRLNVARALQTQTACAYTLNSSGASFGTSGGGGSNFGVSAQANCDWAAQSNATWIMITMPGQPSGAGVVNFTVAANGGAARTGTITAADQTFTITQAGTPPTVQFAAASITASEASGVAQFIVTRTGDISIPSNVDVRTIDDTRAIRCDDTTSAPGVAFARCDYATTVQTITFASNETTKTVAVPLINDAHVEPDESVQLALSNPTGGATLGSQSTTTLTITSDDAAGAPNPITRQDQVGTDFFVRMQYLDFLSREPEPGQPWSNVLNNCPAGDISCDRVSVSANFFLSDEFKLKGFFVFNFYKSSLARLPLYAEIVADMSSITATTTTEVNAKKAAFTNAFVQRQEFKNLYDAMDNATFVNTLMNRYSLQSITTPNPATPDDSSAAAKVTLTRVDLVSRLNAATLTRAQVVRAVAGSDEVSRAEFNSAFVSMQYFGYLRRDPDTQGFNDWLRTVNADPTGFRSMVNGFVNSDEYRLRFGKTQ
jgi:subtilisin family serine protease